MKIEHAYGFCETVNTPAEALAKVKESCVKTDPEAPYVESTAEFKGTANAQILERCPVTGPSFVARVWGNPGEIRALAKLLKF